MRERSIDEFESIFEQASIPVLDIKRVSLSRLAVVAMGGAVDETAAGLARYLHGRFGCGVATFCPSGRSADAVTTRLELDDIKTEVRGFSSTAELVGHISIARSQLIILPLDDDEATVDLDDVVEGTRPPILLMRRPTGEPQRVFERVLHCLSGNFQQTQNFEYSFTLAAPAGSLILFHVVAQAELDEVRATLRLAPDIQSKSHGDLIERLAKHGERYLKGVVAAARDEPFDVTYRLTIGDIAPAVHAALQAEPVSLLVVGSHREGHSHVTGADYRLMHEVTDIPVLAL